MDPCTAADYRPQRSLLALALGLGALLALAAELPGVEVGALPAALADLAARLGLPWFASFLERLAADGLELGMAAALLLLSVYGAVQWLGARADQRCLARAAVVLGQPATPGQDGGLLLATLSGRPASLCRGFAHAPCCELHFGFGRARLLEPLRLGLWGFPVVGFIGTVLGVSGAVRDLPAAMHDNGALGNVLGSLHLAFDTTFIGLVASVLLMLLLSGLDGLWTMNEETARHLFAPVPDGSPR